LPVFAFEDAEMSEAGYEVHEDWGLASESGYATPSEADTSMHDPDEDDEDSDEEEESNGTSLRLRPPPRRDGFPPPRQGIVLMILALLLFTSSG